MENESGIKNLKNSVKNLLRNTAGRLLQEVLFINYDLSSIPVEQISQEQLLNLRMSEVLGGGDEGIVIDISNEERGVNEVAKFFFDIPVTNQFMIDLGTDQMSRLSEPGQKKLNRVAKGQSQGGYLTPIERICIQNTLYEKHPDKVAPVTGVIKIEDTIVGYKMPRYTGRWMNFSSLSHEEQKQFEPIAGYVDDVWGVGNFVKLEDGHVIMVDMQLDLLHIFIKDVIHRPVRNLRRRF